MPSSKQTDNQTVNPKRLDTAGSAVSRREFVKRAAAGAGGLQSRAACRRPSPKPAT